MYRYASGDEMTDTILLEDSSVNNSNLEINFDHAIALAERLDFLDIQLLRKFYMNGKEQPFDLQPHCLPILYREMKVTHRVKIGLNAFRYRLNNLVKLGVLDRIYRSNPALFTPVRDKDSFVKAVITKFFLINGLLKFL